MKTGKLFLLPCAMAILVAPADAGASHGAQPSSFHSSHSAISHSGHGWGRGHGRGGYFYFGAGFYGLWPGFYPDYFAGYDGYALPMAGDSFLVQSTAPVQYVEMAPPPTASDAKPPAANAWYYCKTPEGYYPYVKACNGNWDVVPAQPPGK